MGVLGVSSRQAFGQEGVSSWAETASEGLEVCTCEERGGREKGASEVTFSQPASFLPGAP